MPGTSVLASAIPARSVARASGNVNASERIASLVPEPKFATHAPG
jgi:hypothetical protein